MQGNIIDRLFLSFSDLERAIESAKRTLESKGAVSPEVIRRLESYDGILAKQRSLASALCESISKGDWEEVSRNVGLINGLSAMIRDDARSILSSLSAQPGKTHASEEEVIVC